MTTHPLSVPIPAALIAAILMLASSPAGARQAAGEQVEALHREITSLRVVDELALTPEQIAELVPLVEEGIGLVEDLEAVDAQNQRASLPVLRAVRDDLRDDGEVGEAAEAALRDHGKACEESMRPVLEELRSLAEDVMAVLDEDQRGRVQEALDRSPWERRAERRARRAGEPAPSHPGLDLPPEAQQELRRRNLRKLFGLVFSAEFLQVLQQA